MALIGGAGNPVGGIFTGTAEALEIIGNHAYAYNTAAAVTTAAPILNFKTGNYYLVGQLIVIAPIKFASADIASGLLTALEIKFNGGVIGYLKHDTPNEDMATTWMNIIIPSYTEVLINHVEDAATATYFTSVSLTGRIYR